MTRQLHKQSRMSTSTVERDFIVYGEDFCAVIRTSDAAEAAFQAALQEIKRNKSRITISRGANLSGGPIEHRVVTFGARTFVVNTMTHVYLRNAPGKWDYDVYWWNEALS